MTDPAQSSEAVLTVLRRVGGGVAVPELAYKTGLQVSVVIDALCDLEDLGLARPWSWTAVQEDPRDAI